MGEREKERGENIWKRGRGGGGREGERGGLMLRRMDRGERAGRKEKTYGKGDGEEEEGEKERRGEI